MEVTSFKKKKNSKKKRKIEKTGIEARGSQVL